MKTICDLVEHITYPKPMQDLCLDSFKRIELRIKFLNNDVRFAIESAIEERIERIYYE
jgi:hypothetical protein